MPLRNDEDTSTTVELSPMVKHNLMIGGWPKFRCKSWVAFGMLRPAERDVLLDRCWEAYEAALTEEAARFGFVPASVSGEVPAGDGVTAWEKQFRAEHEY